MADHPVYDPDSSSILSSSWGASLGYVVTHASGWTYRYDAAGDLINASFSSPAPSGSAESASTGLNQLDNSYSIWGHTIPFYVFGVGRIGGELISGPWFDGGNVSGGISYGVSADTTTTKTLLEIAFDSEVVWQGSKVGDGTALDTSTGFTVEAFTCRFYSGSLSQSADSLETTHYGARANAYRPQTMLFIENLPLANTKFGRFPYVSCKFSDSDGTDVNFGDAFEKIAYSPFVGLTSDQFETTDITDGVTDGGIIIAQDTEFLQLIKQFGRFYPNWDIIQTDKLRIVDRGATVAPDITLDTTRLIDKVVVTRQGPDRVPKDLELSTIDPDADFTIIPSLAIRPLSPVAVTTSRGKSASYLPVIMDAATRASVVTLARYNAEATRKTISGTATAYGLEIEPGALVSIDPGGDYGRETFRIIETTRGINNVVEFVGRAILKCNFNFGGCGEAVQFLDRTSGLDATHVDAYTAMICGLVDDGVWTKLDVLRIYATQDSTTALLNLRSSRYKGTLHGAPTFTTDRGFTGTDLSSTIYIDSGFNPSTARGRYGQNDAHMSAWFLNTAAHEPPNGYSSGSGTDSYVWPRYSVDGKAYCRINATNAGNPGTPPGYDGFFGGDRDHTLNYYYRNGTAFDTKLVTPLPRLNLKFYELACNIAGTASGSGSQQSMWSCGGHLTTTEWLSFYNRVRTYMTAVGVP